MKLKFIALAMAAVLAVGLTGCSAERDENSAPLESSSMGQNSAGVNTAAPRPGNDADEGGGAGGTNDQDNDGVPDGSAGVGADQGSGRSGGGNVLDDIGDAAGDALQGAGNAIGDVGRAMR